MANRPSILILGPTAGGKTALAIGLAKRLSSGGECVCADSMQVYIGMDIGTGKPTESDQAGIPHHLLNVTDPDDDSFSLDRWLDLAEQAIADIHERDNWPIVVGGTNLYVQSLLYGLLEGPAPDQDLRRQVQDLPSEQRRAWLERVDPEAALRIHPNDLKRTARAIEVFEKTGKPISQLQTHWDRTLPPDNRSFLIIGLDYTVEAINRRINARVKGMIEMGLVEEVRHLHSQHRLGRNAREALGYKQIIDHLEGRCSLDEAIEQIKIRTRRYAKQQRTWLRRFKNWPGSTWINADDLDTDRVVELAMNAVDNRPLPSVIGVPANQPPD